MPHVRRTAVAPLLALLLVTLAAPAPAAPAASRLTGRVVDADTQVPIRGAEVELANQSGGQGYFRARTDAQGRFAIDRVPPDRWYTLTAGADGYADFVLGGWQFPGAQRLVDLVIPLDRAGALDVALARSDRSPVAGARVRVTEERGNRWWEGFRPPPAPRFTDARGHVRFDGLTAGTYSVDAEVSGLRPAHAARVTVRRGETTPVPLAMTRPATIAGTLKLADGSPVAGVAVTARGPGEAVGTTDTDGTFAIGDLAPGRYRLDVTADGLVPFATKEPIAVAEGATREGVALTVTPRPAEFAFSIEREAFLPEATVRIGLRSFRVDDVDLVLYRVPDALLLDAARDGRKAVAANDTTGLVRVDAWRHVVGRGPDWTWREGEVTVPRALEPGAYVLRGRGGALLHSVAFYVTDLGLVVKRSATRILTAAGSLRSGRPVADARVYIVPVPASERDRDAEGRGWSALLARRGGVAPVRTDAEGLVTVPTPGGVPATLGASAEKPARLRVVAISDEHGVSVADAPLAGAAEQGGDKLFLYTDRPIYRPGHTVYWKAFARRADGDRYTRAQGDVSLTLTAPDGTNVDVTPQPLSAHGSADGEVALPSELPLGDWTLSATTGRASAAATVAVQEYRKPEFSVEVTPDRPVYVNGDEVRFRIAASYFFGAPVFGATVRYNLFETRLGGASDFDEEDGGGYGRVLKSGETRTDLDGRADVVFAPERASVDRRLTLEVEVVDAANRVVSGRGSVVVGRGLFAVTVRPRQWVVRAGDAVPLEVTTIDHAGKPVSAAVTVTLDQDAWNPLTRRYTRSTRPLAVATVTTGADGRAGVSLTPSPARAGPITIAARADDAKGNRITATANVWAIDAGVSEYPYRYPALEVIADRDRYRAGDSVRVVINTDVRGATVLATLEGRDLYEARTVGLAGGTGVVAFPLRAEYAPNAFVTVSVRKGREVHTRTLDVTIDAARHDLAITLTPDRDAYAPGDSARIAVETRTAAGAPAAAEVSVGVVDEAIYALRADGTPDPHDVFYGRRPNWVTTTIAFPSLLLGGADKSGRDEPRRDFRDVARWAPVVRTGADGRAVVGVRWPDNLTTWRITSRGATDATLVGKAVAKTRVTKDLVARLATPRFLVAGDEASLVSIVTNRTDRPIADGEQSLEARGAVLAGPAKAAFTAPARGEARAEWRVKAPVAAGDEAAFTFRARMKRDANARNADARDADARNADAIELRVPLRPRAVALRPGGGTVVEGGKGAAVATLPPDLVRGGSSVALEVSASPLAMAFAGAQHLLAHEYGGTEQTANGVLAALAVVRAAPDTAGRPPAFRDAAALLRKPLSHLAALQLEGGGWGWWKPSEFDPYLTALALDALARAVRAGVAPAEARNALGNAPYLAGRAFAAARSADGEAYLLAHLASVPGVEGMDATLKTQLEELADVVVANRAELGNAGLALAVRGLAALGRAAPAKQLATLLASRAVKDARGVHWAADPDRDSDWFGEDVDATGAALAALANVTPQDALAAEAVRWLAAHRTGPAWRSTRETAPVVEGLAAFATARPSPAAAAQRITVEWNGERVLDRTVANGTAAAEPLRATVAGATLRPGDNRIVVTRTGVAAGAPAAFVSWTARALVPSPGPATAKDSPLHVTREYLRAERTADRRGRPRYLATVLEPGAAFRVGDQVLVRLTLSATRVLNHVLIEDPRIAGFEIDALLPDGVERPWDVNAEERDDRAAFFVGRLESGDTVIEYLVRPEITGTFAALPCVATGFYAPELRARSGDAVVVVGDAGKRR